MGNFDRGNRGSSGRSFGRRDSGGGRSFDRPTTMYKVTCSECGKEAEVPFRPTGDRPVYCRDCFTKQGGRDGRGSRPSFKRDEGRRETPNNSAQLDAINSKLDQLIKLLTPSSAPLTTGKEEAHSASLDTAQDKSSGQVKNEQAPVVKKKKVSKKAPVAPEEI